MARPKLKTLQGSFIVEELTDLVEETVLQEFEAISRRGGVLEQWKQCIKEVKSKMKTCITNTSNMMAPFRLSELTHSQSKCSDFDESAADNTDMELAKRPLMKSRHAWKELKQSQKTRSAQQIARGCRMGEMFSKN